MMFNLFKLWQTCPSWFQKKTKGTSSQVLVLRRQPIQRSWPQYCQPCSEQAAVWNIDVFTVSLKVMQNGSKDVCCLSGRGQLQTDRELSTPNCHTARSTRSLPSQFTELLGTTNLVVWKGCNMAKFITNSSATFRVQ